ncbi:MAG: hypothetical protein ACI8W8_003721, partial [Rhodothermales bacterium]
MPGFFGASSGLLGAFPIKTLFFGVFFLVLFPGARHKKR